MVSTEQLRSGITIEEERATYLHSLAFEAIAAVALSREESRGLIVSAARAWAGEDSGA